MAIVVELVCEQHLYIGRTLDRHLRDRALSTRRHLGNQELSAVGRPAVGAQIEEIFRTREEPLVTAGGIRRAPEQLSVACSCRRKDDALPVGRPERSGVGRRVGREPGQRCTGKTVDPDIVLSSQRETRAVGRYSNVAVRVRREARRSRP